MPALAFRSFIQSNALRSVAWNTDLNARAIDFLEMRNVPRAEVSAGVDATVLKEIELAITGVFGTINTTTIALSSLVGATSTTTVNVGNIKNAATDLVTASKALGGTLETAIPRIQGAFTGLTASTANDTVNTVNNAHDQLKTTLATIQSELNKAFSGTSQPEGPGGGKKGSKNRRDIGSTINKLATSAQGSLTTIQQSLDQIQTTIQDAVKYALLPSSLTLRSIHNYIYQQSSV
ncbi:hypothetical protein DL96DRAFT_1764065 [Flagelloscypha sp. PMI_526]|nr:hypothetical protein DL96DRAFT_1764065 [Flagelloscypha sp. PMI_526]